MSLLSSNRNWIDKDSVETLKFQGENLSSVFERLGKNNGGWTSGFNINGSWYGGNYNPIDDTRIDLFRQHFPNANTVLEIGCLEGGHTVRMQQLRVEKITCLEGRESNINKARVINKIFGYGDVSFFQGDIEQFNFLPNVKFDAIVCIGVLYHLIDPIATIKKLSKLSDNLFIWTHYHAKASTFQAEGDLNSSTSGLQKKALWLSKNSLLQAVANAGYVTMLQKDEPNPNGPCITLALSKGGQA